MQINKFIDHTLLKAFATSDEIRKLCEEAKKYNFKSVCVNPVHVSLAKECLEGSEYWYVQLLVFHLVRIRRK